MMVLSFVEPCIVSELMFLLYCLRHSASPGTEREWTPTLAYYTDMIEGRRARVYGGKGQLKRNVTDQSLTLNAVLVRVVDKADALEQRREQVQRHARRAPAQLPLFLHGLVQSVAMISSVIV